MMSKSQEQFKEKVYSERLADSSDSSLIILLTQNLDQSALQESVYVCNDN